MPLLIEGTSDNDTLNGTAVDEVINGFAGNDTINGEGGDDVIYGGDGNDTLNGGDGNDVLEGGNGNDIIDGGAGIDTVSYASASQYVWINLSVTWPYDTRGGHLDGMINVENVIGSDFDDRLTGNNVANQINGGAGNDFIVGGAGDDVLTGGSGNDHFLYYVGDGKDTITDLAIGDEISFDGYSSAQSVTQVGNDVIVVFSATDQITFLNTTIAAVEAFLPHPHIFTQPPSTIIPLLPTRLESTTATGTVVLNGAPTVTIAPDQVYHGVGIDPTFGPYGAYFRVVTGSPLIFTNHEFVFDWHLINQGTIWNSSTLYHVNSVWADSFTNSGTVVAEVGPFDPPGMASMQYWGATAVFVLGRSTGGGLANPALNNSGQIFAIGDQGGATAVASDAYNNGFINSGLIAAQATVGADPLQAGGAVGFSLTNSNYVVNEVGGRILVEGDRSAIGISIGRGSHPAFPAPPQVDNRGLIEVVSHNPSNPGIAIQVGTTGPEKSLIVNSGTIRADIAILAKNTPADTSSAPSYHMDSVQNLAGGLIEGDIRLDTGNDTLTNAGTIRGTVDMGGHDDLVDNSAGVIDGVVLLGSGTDNFIGGASADRVRGGDGHDTLNGAGGADLLEGDFGDDTLDGGAGNDGLYGGAGHDMLRTSGGDVVRGGYGNDRIETGDYSFAQIDGGAGYDRWVLSTGARLFDLAIIAASGRVTGIEEIDLRGSQTLVVHAADLAPITGGETLHLRGGPTDSIYLAGTWASAGSVVEDGVTYSRYQSGSSIVLIESSMQVAIGSSPPAASGLDPIAGGTAAPPPSVDPDSNVYWVSRFPVTDDLVINADEVWKSPDGAAILSFAYQPVGGQLYDAPDIVNYGQIINDAGVGVIAIAVGGGVRLWLARFRDLLQLWNDPGRNLRRDHRRDCLPRREQGQANQRWGHRRNRSWNGRCCRGQYVRRHLGDRFRRQQRIHRPNLFPFTGRIRCRHNGL